MSGFKGCFLSQEIVSCSEVHCNKVHSPKGATASSMNHFAGWLNQPKAIQAHDLCVLYHSRNGKYVSHTWFLGWVFN